MDPDEILLGLTVLEVALLCNAINEAIEVVDDWEFPIRVGASVAQARRLHQSLSEIIAR